MLRDKMDSDFIWMRLGSPSPSKGSWCSGITPAQHAGGPGFNPQRVHICAQSTPSFHRKAFVSKEINTLHLLNLASIHTIHRILLVCIVSKVGRESATANATIDAHGLPRARARGVVVSHPLSMREALGSIPSESIFALNRRQPAFH